MSDDKRYQRPMEAWQELQPYSQNSHLPRINLNLFYLEAGAENKTTIVMIHGLGDEADTWRHIFIPLSKSYHLIALDLPGFGRSDKPERDYTPKFMMESIIALMNLLEIDKAILMGSSLGAMLSQGIALGHPARVSGLILVDGALLQKKPMLDWSFGLMRIPLIGEFLYNRLRKDPDAAFDSLRNVYHDLDNLPEADREFLYTRVNKRVWSDGQRRAFFSTLRHLTGWAKDIQADLPGQLADLETATLVIRGEHDELFPVENAEGVTNVQPNASLVTLEDAKHLPQQEVPTLFLKKVQEWLSRYF